MKYYKNEFNCNILSFLYCILYIKFNIRYYKKIEDLYEVIIIIIFFNL